MAKSIVFFDTEIGVDSVNLTPSLNIRRLRDKFERRIMMCKFILGELFAKATRNEGADTENKPVEFSM